MPKRDTEPKAQTVYVHVDRRQELIDSADQKRPELLHSFKDKARASAQELGRLGMKIIYQDEYYADPNLPHEPVAVDDDILVASSRDRVINERISRELMSKQKVERSMKNQRNEDRGKWKPSTILRKPKRAEDIGIPEN